MIAAITSGGSKVDKMVVAGLKDDPAETLEDASDYEFGVQFNTGAENMKAAVMDIQDQIGDISTTEYKSVQEQAEALISGEVDAIIYNQSYTELMENAVKATTIRSGSFISTRLKRSLISEVRQKTTV